MKKSIKTVITIVAIVALAVSSIISAYAYNNGSVAIYRGETRLGAGQIFTNSETVSNRALTAQTRALVKQNSVMAKAIITYMNDDFEIATLESQTKSAANASVVTVDLEIPNEINPIDARGIFAINTSVERICKMYNNGQGVTECSEGSACTFAN